MTETTPGPSFALHLGECLDGLAALPDRSANHVITDPPYSARVHAGMGKERRNDGTASVAAGFDHLDAPTLNACAAHFARVARRWVVTFCDLESVQVWKDALEAAGCTWAVTGLWVKSNPMPRLDGTRPAYGAEAICIAHAPRTKGKTRWNGGGRAALYTFGAQEGKRDHPTQKPLALMEALVRDFTDPGDMVLDPFAGSGTTGVACRRLGRSFLGWERDPVHHATATARISAAREQLGLFQGAA